MKRLIILIASAGWVAPAIARESVPVSALTLGGTSRIRYETIAGQARTGFDETDDLLNIRTTLSAEVDLSPVKLTAELYDSRAYLAEDGTPISTNEVNTLELVQAFAKLDLGAVAGAGSSMSLRAGRYLLNLGSRRLVAADDYRNTTNSYTGLRADVATRSGWTATAIYVLPQMRRPDRLDDLRDNRVAVDRESFDLVLLGGVVARARAIGAATVELSYFHLNERDAPGRPTRDRSLDNLAVRVMTAPEVARVDGEIEGIVQLGHAATGLAETSERAAVRAWFLHADVGYSLGGPWKPRLSVEYDRASGEGRGRRIGRFDLLFGMRRADLAPSGLYNAVGRSNLSSPGVRVEAASSREVDLFVGYRPLWLASRFDAFSSTGVRDATGRSGRFAGHQLDSRLRWTVNDALRLEVDGVLLAKGRFLRDAPNAPPGRWTRYLSLNATAVF